MVEQVTFGNPGTVENTAANTATNAYANMIDDAIQPGMAGIDFTSFSPDTLLEFVEMQLRKTDGEICSMMKTIDTRREASQKLGEAAASLKQVQTELETNPEYLKQSMIEVIGTEPGQGGVLKNSWFPNTPAGKKAADEYAAKLIQVTETVPATSGEIQGLHDTLAAAAKKAKAAGFDNIAEDLQQMADDVANGKGISKGAVEKELKDLETTQQTLSSSAETSMLKLQELVQERARKIMFATNAMASIDQTSRKIIENTR